MSSTSNAETKAGFRKSVADALTGFEGYKFDVGEHEDSSWGQYLNVLYPSLEDLERIANMDLLDELVKRGDVLTVPREVQHWVSFRSEQSRALFREAAKGAGYSIVGETESEGEFRFGMSVTRTQPIEQKLIDQTVIELLRLCRTFNGDYEGLGDAGSYAVRALCRGQKSPTLSIICLIFGRSLQ